MKKFFKKVWEYIKFCWWVDSFPPMDNPEKTKVEKKHKILSFCYTITAFLTLPSIYLLNVSVYLFFVIESFLFLLAIIFFVFYKIAEYKECYPDYLEHKAIAEIELEQAKNEIAECEEELQNAQKKLKEKSK